MFQKLADSLKPTAAFVIEDYWILSPLTDDESEQLEKVVGVAYLPTFEEYKQQLEAVGFTDIVIEDLTSIWSPWTTLRRDAFIENK